MRRTTIRLDDDLMRELRRRATADELSLTDAVNVYLRRGLASPPVKRKPFRQRTYSLGPPKVNLDKALSVAAMLEDDEVLRKLAEGK